MNRHQKLAVLIAPFLIVGGYVAADYYVLAKEKSALQEQAYQFELQAPCNLQANNCLLKKGTVELKLALNTSLEQLSLSSNQALDGVTLSLNADKATRLSKDGSNRHWVMTTSANAESLNKLRLATSINKAFYFAEINVSRSAE